MEVDPDQNLVLVNVGIPGGGDLGSKTSFVYSAVPANCRPDVFQLTNSVQITDINRIQPVAQIQPIQYPQVQVSFGGGIDPANQLLPNAAIYPGFSPVAQTTQPFTPYLNQVQPQPLHLIQPVVLVDQKPTSNSVLEPKYPESDSDYYKEIVCFLTNRQLPVGVSQSYVQNLKKRAKHYVMLNGLLHHNPTFPKVVVTNTEEQNQLLNQTHVDQSGVHLGVVKMMAKLQDKYFWRGMRTGIVNLVKTCEKCQDSICSEKITEEKGITQFTQTMPSVWSNVEIRVHGPFKVTNSRNEFIVTIADPVSCFITAAPTPTNGQCTKITHFIAQTFFLLGFPRARFLGPEALFDDVSDQLDRLVRIRRPVSKYFQRGDEPGLPWVTLVIRSLIEKHPSRWDKELDRCLYSFRTGGLKSIMEMRRNEVPFYAMFQRSPDVPAEPTNETNSKRLTICQYCGDKFLSKSSLKRHMKLHLSCSLSGNAKNLVDSKESMNGPHLASVLNDIKSVLVKAKEIRRKRGKYQKFPDELQYHIAKFALKNGCQQAATHFSALLGTSVSNSTVRSLLKTHSKIASDEKRDLAENVTSKEVKFGTEGSDCLAQRCKSRLSTKISENVEGVEELGALHVSEVRSVSDPSGSEPKTELSPENSLENSNPRRTGKKRGRYIVYSPEIRAEIGKYAAEHGCLEASAHFSKSLGHDLPESTARGLKLKYLNKLKHCQVTSLGYSPRGRPLILGKYDEVVQKCLRQLVRSGEKVTSYLAITTAKRILNEYEPALLDENGGKVVLNTSWAKSFLKRIGLGNNS